jgi:phospholipid-binding lipoprotein MlaA
VSLGRRFFVALFVAAVAAFTVPGNATAEVPAAVAAQINAVAADYRARIEYHRRNQLAAPNPGLARLLADNDRRIAESRMSAVVIAAITAHPTLAGEVMGEASAAAPELDRSVREQVSLAFPFRTVQPVPPKPPPVTKLRPPPSGSPASVRTSPIPPPSAAAPAAPTSFGEVESEEDEEEAAVAALAANDIAPPADDPLEPLNRGVFWVNDTIDQWIFRPIAWTYGKLMPEPIKQGLRNVVRNLKGPIILANDLLQLEFADASVTAARFLANTTLGLGGLFDVADAMGLKYHPADLGQTLHAYGVASGPYIVLPVLGPSTVRDGVGEIGGAFLDPTFYLLNSTERLIKFGSTQLVDRERVLAQTDELRKSSLDYYAAIRSLYLQNRAIELQRGGPEASAGTVPWGNPDSDDIDQGADLGREEMTWEDQS